MPADGRWTKTERRLRLSGVSWKFKIGWFGAGVERAFPFRCGIFEWNLDVNLRGRREHFTVQASLRA